MYAISLHTFQIHLHEKILCFILLVQSSKQIFAHPLAHPELNKEFPVAYNLHQEFTPRDINDLGHEQKKKAIYDVRTTISEVEKLLALDPNLPRLTRFVFLIFIQILNQKLKFILGEKLKTFSIM